MTFYFLCFLSFVGLVWDIRQPDEGRTSEVGEGAPRLRQKKSTFSSALESKEARPE